MGVRFLMWEWNKCMVRQIFEEEGGEFLSIYLPSKKDRALKPLGSGFLNRGMHSSGNLLLYIGNSQRTEETIHPTGRNPIENDENTSSTNENRPERNRSSVSLSSRRRSYDIKRASSLSRRGAKPRTSINERKNSSI